MDSRSRFRANFNRGRSEEPTTHQPQSVHTAVPEHHIPAEHKADRSKKAKKVSLFFGRRWLLVVIVILALGLVGLGYGYMHTKNELNKAKNPETAGQTEIQKLTSSVGKTIKLPTETPTLATVTNVGQLKNQEFFKEAQNGDKVLIYTKAGRALLYRPSTKQVIEYARVNLGNNQ